MHVIKSHKVSSIPNKIRLIQYCEGLFAGLPSKSSIKKAFKRKEIYLNQEIAETGHWVQVGDVIDWVDLENHPPQPYQVDLKVLYEDDFLIAVEKPAGLPVNGNQFRTLQNALPFNTQPSDQIDALKWPRPVHRLDTQTTGIVLCAKTAKSRKSLGEQFENHQIKKTYHAIVVGQLKGNGIIEKAIDGKKAISNYESIKIIKSLRTEYLTLVKLSPVTGRTHQLRIHMNSLGHPIVGDPIYGDDVAIRHKGLFLTASRVELIHPKHQTPLIVDCPTPYKFHSLLAREERRWLKYHKE